MTIVLLVAGETTSTDTVEPVLFVALSLVVVVVAVDLVRKVRAGNPSDRRDELEHESLSG